MNEADAAVISTAHATWALFWATVALAILTLVVAIAAVGVPQWQRNCDKEEKKERQNDIDAQAEDAIAKTRQLIDEVKTDLERVVAFDQFPLWALANRLHTQRRVVEFFFVPGSVSPSIPYRLSACMQAIDEASDGVQQALNKGGLEEASHQAALRRSGAGTAGRALERLDAALDPTH